MIFGELQKKVNCDLGMVFARKMLSETFKNNGDVFPKIKISDFNFKFHLGGAGERLGEKNHERKLCQCVSMPGPSSSSGSTKSHPI